MNDQASSQSLLEMHDRVLAVASLYDILARSDRSDTVCLQDYVTQIVESLKAAIGNSDISWQTKCAGDAPINGEQAFHLGLRRDKQGETPASIRMRTRGWGLVGRA